VTYTRTVDNSADVLDSRDIIERAAELEDPEEEENYDGERETLAAFIEDASEVSDWPYGETFIRDSYFEEYAQELADDIGAIDSDASWPNTCIDWERAARELQQDYTSYEFDGVTYWARA
jgi:hypothetical protein